MFGTVGKGVTGLDKGLFLRLRGVRFWVSGGQKAGGLGRRSYGLLLCIVLISDTANLPLNVLDMSLLLLLDVVLLVSCARSRLLLDSCVIPAWLRGDRNLDFAPCTSRCSSAEAADAHAQQPTEQNLQAVQDKT